MHGITAVALTGARLDAWIRRKSRHRHLTAACPLLTDAVEKVFEIIGES
jgi:hypothetical protein